jgi:hypothetical protein
MLLFPKVTTFTEQLPRSPSSIFTELERRDYKDVTTGNVCIIPPVFSTTDNIPNKLR